jgi:DNA primase
MKAHFQRHRLPSVAAYFDGIGLRAQGSGAWRSALCPFHGDHNPSLRVNVETGAFRCMACGAHGGDVLAFERLRTGRSFADAARDLGAWGQP